MRWSFVTNVRVAVHFQNRKTQALDSFPVFEVVYGTLNLESTPPSLEAPSSEGAGRPYNAKCPPEVELSTALPLAWDEAG